MSHSAQSSDAYRGVGSVRRLLKIPYHHVGLVVALFDVGLIVCASILGNVGYQYFWLGAVWGTETNLGVGLLAAFFYGLLARSRGLYTLPSLLVARQSFSVILIPWATVLLVVAFLLFLLKAGTVLSRGSIVSFGLLGLALLVAFRVFASSFLRDAVATGSIVGRRAVVLGEPDELAKLSSLSLLRLFGIEEVSRVVLTIDRDAGSLEWSSEQVSKIDRALEVARASYAEEVIVALHWSSMELLELVRERLRYSPLPARLLPDRSITSVIDRSQVSATATFSVDLQREPLTKTERALKRSVDLLGASITILLLCPLMAIVAIAIKLDSPGPLIFRQRRKGFNGRPFVIYKFRTMKVMEDGPTVAQARRRDPRVTTIGRLLRRSSIDELPQLFNVLKGDMSLVGPRPHALAHDDEYGSMIANYAFRHHVKPGITGWAQVNGCRGETSRVELMVERVEADLWYINNWSFWLDMRILLGTCLEVIRTRSAY